MRKVTAVVMAIAWATPVVAGGHLDEFRGCIASVEGKAAVLMDLDCATNAVRACTFGLEEETEIDSCLLALGAEMDAERQYIVSRLPDEFLLEPKSNGRIYAELKANVEQSVSQKKCETSRFGSALCSTIEIENRWSLARYLARAVGLSGYKRSEQ